MSDFDTWVATTRTKLTSAAESEAATAALLGLPTTEDAPRPGIARNWTFDDWIAWGAPYQLLEDGSTKHAHMLRHPKIPSLCIGMSTSSGDRRSRLAMATQFRCRLRSCLEFATRAALRTLTAMGTAGRPEDEDGDFDGILRRMTFELIATVGVGDFLNIEDMGAETNADSIETSTTPIWSKLSKQAALEKASPRVVLRRAIELVSPMDPAYLERLYTALSKGVPQLLTLCRMVSDRLDDYIELYKATEEERAAEKAAAREATRAASAKTEAALPQAVPTDDILKAVKSAVSALEAQASNLAKQNERVIGLAASNSMLRSQVAELEAELLAKTKETAAQLDEMAAKVAAAEADCHIAQQLLAEQALKKDWRPTLEALVRTVKANLSSTDFLALATGISHARGAVADAETRLELNEP